METLSFFGCGPKNERIISPHFAVKIVFLVLLVSFSLNGLTQILVRGIVKDSKTRQTLAYCNITFKGNHSGTLSNNDGEFNMNVLSLKDTLVISFLGYKTMNIPVEELQRDPSVYLVPVNLELKLFTVHADNDYLYDMLANCRKRLHRSRSESDSRVYFGLQTRSQDKPIELLECYFNARLEGENVQELRFKNGRTALAAMFNNYFISENTSKAISMIKLTKDEGYFPSLPLQFNKQEMKRLFAVEWVDASNDMTHLKFSPVKDTTTHFSGDIWLDKTSGDLMKICLKCKNTSLHPFLPLFSCDSLTNVSLSICNTYKKDGSESIPDYFNFEYDFTYHCIRDTPLVKESYRLTRDMVTEGIMMFYDYGDPFILPRIEYNNDFDDYRKMSIIPYNPFFWDNNNKLLLTGQQIEDLSYLSKDGVMMNFGEGSYGTNFLPLPGLGSNNHHSLWEYNFTFWSSDKRIILSRQYFKNEVYSKEKINQSIQRDLYNLKVLILLDINQANDSINLKSYTVFDSEHTFYHLPEMPYTNVFLNIYFDICEIERRKLDEQLMKQHSQITVIDSIYKASLEKMNLITETYLKEVQQGKNEKQLKKWNDYVKDRLGIDNLKMFYKN